MNEFTELQKRILVGALLLITAFPLIMFTHKMVFIYLMAIVFLLASWEWIGLIAFTSVVHKIMYVTGVMLILLNTIQVLDDWRNYVIFLHLIFWALISWLVYYYPKFTWWQTKGYLIAASYVYLSTALMGFVMLRSLHSPIVLLELLLFVIIADSSAYFCGKLFGKNKLLPRVSPGKTIEGLIGALILTVSYGYLVLYNDNFSAVINLLVMLGLFLLSVIGDLFISMLKRNVKLKDTGSLLPGHGGILDRIDSVNAVILPFAVFYGN